MFDVWIIVPVFLLLLSFYLLRGKSGNFPPGPSGWPFIGSAFELDPTGPHKTMGEWAKTYGDIVKFKMFGIDYVLLSSYDLLREALITKTALFAGRPPMFRFLSMYRHTASIVASNFSPKWFLMKKLAKQCITTFGGKKALETISVEDIEVMVKNIREKADTGEPVEIAHLLHECTASIITAIVFGDRLSTAAIAEIRDTEVVFNSQTIQAGAGVFLDAFPWMRYFPLRAQFQEVKEAGEMVFSIVNKQLELAKERHVPGDPKCFVDGLLEHQRAGKNGPSELVLSDDDVYAMTYDMINAGTGATYHTLNALLAVLTNKPEIQRKITEEINHEIGQKRITLDDVDKLSYLKASIWEILRYHTMLPLGFVHMAITDTTIGGYDIKCGTNVFFNNWKVHHDPEFWDDPWEFKPNRFLDQDGQLVTAEHPNRKRVLAFSEGRRKCLGDTLAINRLKLMVASLLQHFNLEPESEDKRPLHDPRDYFSGFAVAVKPFKVRIKQMR